MTILLKKNGQVIIDHAQPLEGKDANLDNLAAFIADPQDGNAIVYNATKGIWEAGEVSGGGTFVIHADSETMALDKTWQEINDAFSVGSLCVVVVSGLAGVEQYIVCKVYRSTFGEVQGFIVATANQFVNLSTGEVTSVGLAYVAETANGYPVYTEG